MRWNPEALKYVHVACVRKIRRSQLSLGEEYLQVLRDQGDRKRAGYGVLIELG